MPKVATMDELFVDELRDLYDAKKQLTRALPKMAKAANSNELRSAFEEHLTQTQSPVSLWRHKKSSTTRFPATGRPDLTHTCWDTAAPSLCWKKH